VRVVHRRSDRDDRVLATRVVEATGPLARARGLMFRRSFPEGHALVFRFDRPDRRALHMLFVPFDIDVVWLVENEVVRVERLPAWRGLRWATADTVLELPAGAAEGVRPGDVVELLE
jgi:hypothetical protein